MEWLGSLLSAGSSLLGGILGNQAKNAANNQMLNAQGMQDLYGLQWRAGDARAAEKATGINALTLLGSPSIGGVPQLVGSNDLGAGVAAAGQDIGRAVGALAPRDDKVAKLNEELLGLKIQSAREDIVHQQLVNSSLARNVAAPGTGPGLPPYNPMAGGPPDPRPHKGMAPAFASYYDYANPGQPIIGTSSEMSQAAMNTAMLGVNAAMVPMLVSRNLANNPYGSSIRGDVWRGVDNSQYVPF